MRIRVPSMKWFSKPAFSAMIFPVFILVACNQGFNTPQPSPSLEPQNSTVSVQKTKLIKQTEISPEFLSTEIIRQNWEEMPVIPDKVSDRIIAIYQKGVQLNNNPRSFSVIGDCDSTPSWFLGDFDRGQEYYSLGQFAFLDNVINQYKGSFGRESMAVRRGFNSASVLSPLWADQELCLPGETPLGCEIRIHNPSVAFILLGTNDVFDPSKFETNLIEIVEILIEKGIVPILATKADNLEGDNQINSIIARLALEYELPLWNFWKAVQPLPDHGLQKDGAHLTWASNNFDDVDAMEKAWPRRNLTALQTLDTIWNAVQNQD